MAKRSAEWLLTRVEQLRPWRYNHEHDGVMIKSDNLDAAAPFDRYSKTLIQQLVSALYRNNDIHTLRAIDLGCLEGHYSDIICSLGFKDVVSVDLSEGHVERAKFLLQDLKGHANSQVVRGNVSDEGLMSSLGTFNLVLFHGLLYHLKDPLKIFDSLERLVPPEGPFFLLLSTQYRCTFPTLISPHPMAEMQVKPLLPIKGNPGEDLLESPKDGSVFERCSFILNPAAVHAALRLYGYQEIVAYDDPSGYSRSFHSNLIASKGSREGTPLVDRLPPEVNVPGVKFYSWDGRSVNSYHFERRLRVKIAQRVLRLSRKIASTFR